MYKIIKSFNKEKWYVMKQRSPRNSEMHLHQV